MLGTGAGAERWYEGAAEATRHRQSRLDFRGTNKTPTARYLARYVRAGCHGSGETQPQHNLRCRLMFGFALSCCGHGEHDAGWVGLPTVLK